jgi:hypothetical protein
MKHERMRRRKAPSSTWVPLRVELARRVSRDDKAFMDWVRNDPKIDALDILANCLWKELTGHYDENGFVAKSPSGPVKVQGVEMVQAYICTPLTAGTISNVLEPNAGKAYVPQLPVGGHEVLVEGYTGRLRQLAEDFDAAKKLNHALRAEIYVRHRFEGALAKICAEIADGSLAAKGIPVNQGVEGRMRMILPSEITEGMTLGSDGLLYQTADKYGPAWASVEITSASATTKSLQVQTLTSTLGLPGDTNEGVTSVAPEAKFMAKFTQDSGLGSRAKGETGCKPTFVDAHWEILKTEAFRLLDVHGGLSKDDPEFNSKSKLINQLLIFAQNHHKFKDIRAPGRTTIQPYVNRWLQEWEARRAA